MGSFADYLENALLDHVFGTGESTHGQSTGAKDFGRPVKYIALCTTAVIDSNTGSTIVEPTSNSYERIRCHTWDAAATGATENTLPITFNQASGDWGTILDFGIVDAKTAGNLLAYGSLTISKSVQSGDTPKFATGDIDITLT